LLVDLLGWKKDSVDPTLWAQHHNDAKTRPNKKEVHKKGEDKKRAEADGLVVKLLQTIDSQVQKVKV